MSGTVRKIVAETVELYQEKLNALNKDYFYPQYDLAELFQYNSIDEEEGYS